MIKKQITFSVVSVWDIKAPNEKKLQELIKLIEVEVERYGVSKIESTEDEKAVRLRSAVSIL